MINITANGKNFEVADAQPLPAFVEQIGLQPDKVVIERNGEALTQSEAKEVTLTEGDRLEIVRIVAGG